ncbi:hypothetical protein J437_LFUL019014 [Ladona fulva]|uniref:DUF5641 domain-containing protein n=1 Tax=Ladona fulva TaxID=123851 RepID=A0A8K0PBJ9_LADFU|nr:hypothetical protein J437_LFUL019014 [Ladona fulva]
MVAISWIRSSSHKQKTYVANTVCEFQGLISPVNVRHVSSEFDPADCALRGLLPSELLDKSLWMKGPPWLSDLESNWPSKDAIIDPLCQYLELNKNYLSLRRITSLCLRFVYNCHNPKCRLSGIISTRELQTVLLVWIKHIQNQKFQQRIKWLKMAPNLMEGQLIIVKDENLPPLHWRLGCVIKEHPKKDGIARVVELKTVQGVITRESRMAFSKFTSLHVPGVLAILIIATIGIITTEESARLQPSITAQLGRLTIMKDGLINFQQMRQYIPGLAPNIASTSEENRSRPNAHHKTMILLKLQKVLSTAKRYQRSRCPEDETYR